MGQTYVQKETAKLKKAITLSRRKKYKQKWSGNKEPFKFR